MSFIADVFSGLFGGGQTYVPPPAPPPIQAPAVKTTAGVRGKRDSQRLRRRQALSGQGSMISGGSMAGGTTGGQTLMGS